MCKGEVNLIIMRKGFTIEMNRAYEIRKHDGVEQGGDDWCLL